MSPCRVLATVTAALAAATAPGATADAHLGHGATPVDIGAFAFSPQTVNVTVGDVVFWTWKGPDTNHSVTGGGPGKTFDSDPGAGPGQVPNHPVNDGFGEQFTQPGTYDYVCKNHDFMRGSIVVVADTSGGGVPGVDTTKPQLLGLRLSRTRMCPRRSRRCAKPGARLRFTLSERADVEGAIYRVRPGRRTFARFVSFSGRPGGNDVRFSAAGLKPGAYELSVAAYDDADNSSAGVRRRFVVRAS
jgi:plastocyanin